MTLPVAEFVAPLAPAGVIGALGLLALLGTLLAMGMLKAYSETLGAFIRKLASIIDVKISLPHLGSVHPLRGVSHTLYALDKQIYNGFAYLALKGEQASAWCFTTTGNIFWWSVHETADLARDTLHFAQRTTVQTIPASIRKAEAATLARLRGIDHAIGRIEAQAKAQLARLRVGIDRIGHGLTVTLPHAIARVGARVGALERTTKGELARLKRVEKALGIAALTATVSVVLTRLGLGWLRCGNVKTIGKRLCGLHGTQLEAFLLGTTALVGTVSVVEFIKDAQAVEDEAIAAMRLFIREF